MFIWSPEKLVITITNSVVMAYGTLIGTQTLLKRCQYTGGGGRVTAFFVQNVDSLESLSNYQHQHTRAVYLDIANPLNMILKGPE